MINEILELKQNLNEKRFEFCSKHLSSKQKIIYFAYALLDREYINNTFNFWYAFNNYSEIFKVIIGNIGPAQADINKEEIVIYEKYQNGENSVLPKDLDYIVLPFVNYDLTEIVKEIRDNNSNVKILYQIDFDFTSISKKNKDLKQYETNQEIIFKNIKMVDKAVFRNKKLYNYFFENYRSKLKDCGTDGTFNVAYSNQKILESIKNNKESKSKDSPKRIGVLCTKENGADLMYFKKVWDAVDKKHKGKVSWQLYGFKNSSIAKAFNGIKTEFTQETGINSYYNELFNLNLDCFVIPSKNEVWNVNNYDLERIVELQSLGIPVVVSDLSTINEKIKDEVNGFLCEDRDRMIRQLSIICDLDNSSDAHNILTKVSKNAYEHIKTIYNLKTDTVIEDMEDLFLREG